MNNYFKNKLKDRLTYCKSWKHDIDMYLANKEITKQADKEFYKTRPFLKFVLSIYNLESKCNCNFSVRVVTCISSSYVIS